MKRRFPVLFLPAISMKTHLAWLTLVLAWWAGSAHAWAEAPSNFHRENLVVWCVAPPWDAQNRSATERAELLSGMGLKRLAFNWRSEVDFEDELQACAKYGLEYFAFWNEHEDAFRLFAARGIHPQIWKTNPSPKVEGQPVKVRAAADRLRPFAQRAQELGSSFGLYNHGGWGGQPRNLVAVCDQLRGEGLDNVGIVYNFHHAHAQIEGFARAFEQMLPYLLCLNLNGMAEPAAVNEKTQENKILPLGAGVHETAMIAAVVNSGYDGPVGIIGHLKEQDVAQVLQGNLTGLEQILQQIAE